MSAAAQREPRRRRAVDNADLWHEIISTHPQLSAQEEQELARQKTPESIRKLFEHNIKLALSRAHKKAKTFLSRERKDFVQEALSGLYKAAVDFRPLGYRFSTFASFWIRQKMDRYAYEGTRVIRIPPHVTHGREKYPEALSLDLNDQYKVMADRRAILQECDVAARLDECLRQLPKQQADVLRMRFGLDGAEPMMLHQVGEKFPRAVKRDDGTTDSVPLSKERVRQLEALALQELRKPWAQEILAGTL